MPSPIVLPHPRFAPAPPRPGARRAALRKATLSVAGWLLALGLVGGVAQAQTGARTAAQTAAQKQDSAAPAERAAPLWEAGVVGVAVRQQAYPGARQTVGRGLVLPYLIYRGRVLRADDGAVGLRALKTPLAELDVGFAGAFGSRAGASDARSGMPRIGTLVEFGPRLRLNLGHAGGGAWRAALPLRGVFDLDDGLAHRGIAFEPTLGWGLRQGRWRWDASVGAVWGDRRLAQTFYGVAPEFATAQRPAYEARAGLVSTRLSLSLSTALDDDWRVFAFVRQDSVAGAANRASPLVERTRGSSAGLGLAWTWKRSGRSAMD